MFGAQAWCSRSTRSGAGDGYEVFLDGGRTATGRDAVAWAREGAERGAGEILLTSMDRDGTEDGYELDLTRVVADAVDIPVIASGGAGELSHLVDASSAGGADAVLCASIFHYGQYTVGAGEGGDGAPPGSPSAANRLGAVTDGPAELRERMRALPGHGAAAARPRRAAARLPGRRGRARPAARPSPRPTGHRGRGRRARDGPRAGRPARRRPLEHERFETATVHVGTLA